MLLTIIAIGERRKAWHDHRVKAKGRAAASQFRQVWRAATFLPISQPLHRRHQGLEVGRFDHFLHHFVNDLYFLGMLCLARLRGKGSMFAVTSELCHLKGRLRRALLVVCSSRHLCLP